MGFGMSTFGPKRYEVVDREGGWGLGGVTRRIRVCVEVCVYVLRLDEG